MIAAGPIGSPGGASGASGAPPAAAEPPRRDSAGDRALLLGLLLVLALAAALSPIRSYDYWWHLATGRFILAQHEIPRVDPFSFTARGTLWVDHEWLAQVVMYAAHRAFGPLALVAAKAAIVLGLCALLLRHLRREGHGTASAAVFLLVVVLGAAFRFDVRPEMATLALLPIALAGALRARDTGRWAPLVAMPLLAALGANLHPGAVLIPVVLAAGAALAFVLPRLGVAGGPRDLAFAPRLAAAAAASALAVGINPYGFEVYAVPLRIARVLQALPSPNLEWQRPALSQFPIFWAALALSIVALAARRARIDPVAAGGFVVVAVLAMLQLRNIGLFFVLLPLALARPTAGWFRLRRPTEPEGGRPPSSLAWLARLAPGARPGFIASAVVLACGVPLLAVLPPGVAWGAGVAEGNEPRGAVDFLEREQVGDRMFNDVKFGGYLIWRRFPERAVFIDGRNEVYPELLPEIFASLDDDAAWRALLDRHQVDGAFLRYAPPQRVLMPRGEGKPPLVVERAFSSVHFPRQDWALVYWDDDAMVYLRRTPEHAAVIARHEYKAVHPDDWRHLAAGVLAGRGEIGPILDEIRRKLEEDPGSRRARLLLRVFSGVGSRPPAGASPSSGAR